MVNALNQYRSYQVESASPEDLIILLYDGARRFVDKALVGLEHEDYAAVSLFAGKAQRILEELMVTLDTENGGEIAQNLSSLYEYWIWRLSEGLMKKEAQAFREVSAALTDMNEAWQEAAKQVKALRTGMVQG